MPNQTAIERVINYAWDEFLDEARYGMINSIAFKEIKEGVDAVREQCNSNTALIAAIQQQLQMSRPPGLGDIEAYLMPKLAAAIETAALKISTDIVAMRNSLGLDQIKQDTENLYTADRGLTKRLDDHYALVHQLQARIARLEGLNPTAS